jgi:hypothetical protein
LIRLRTISASGGAPATLVKLTWGGGGTLSFEDQARLITTLPNGKVFEIGRVTHRGCDTIRQEHVAQHSFPLQAAQGHLANASRAGLAAFRDRVH